MCYFTFFTSLGHRPYWYTYIKTSFLKILYLCWFTLCPFSAALIVRLLSIVPYSKFSKSYSLLCFLVLIIDLYIRITEILLSSNSSTSFSLLCFSFWTIIPVGILLSRLTYQKLSTADILLCFLFWTINLIVNMLSIIPSLESFVSVPVIFTPYVPSQYWQMWVVPAPDGTIYLVDINKTHYWGSFLVHVLGSKILFWKMKHTNTCRRKRSLYWWVSWVLP